MAKETGESSLGKLESDAEETVRKKDPVKRQCALGYVTRSTGWCCFFPQVKTAL